MRARLWILVLSLCALSACSYLSTDTPPSLPDSQHAEVSQTGEALYLQSCAWCHGDGGKGTSRGPDLLSDGNGEALTDFMLSTGRMPIVSPDEQVGRSEPAFTGAQIDAIVGYVGSLSDGPAIPTVDVAAGDLALGEQLYNENCAACHGVLAQGGALASDDPLTVQIGSRAPPPKGTPTQIAEAMLTGPATMPVFHEGLFSSEEIDSIVAYVRYAQDPDNRGGWAIGLLGPVAEGAVAWILGIGALLFLIRWIGVSVREE